MALNIRAFALAGAVFWGAGIFLLTWWVIALHGATGETTWLGYIYPGYRIDAMGSIVGLVWGTVDGLASFAIFAWLYHRSIRIASR